MSRMNLTPNAPTEAQETVLRTTRRTHTCGGLRAHHVGQTVSLAGWVQTTRDFGKFAFLVLRDRYGFTQVSVIAESQPELYATVKSLSREDVVLVTGTVVERESKNPDLPTGDIEIRPTELRIESRAALPPFLIEDDTDGNEELRLQYRYLDLRRPVMQSRLRLRHAVTRAMREYLDARDFLEVETPNLIKSTPEGARDFLVPSRLQPGSFYALPQSPQILKQLLMVAGSDRYYQIVKCYRDEDFRGDRQPEFTQLDCEMAFVGQEDILQTFEGLTKHVFAQVAGVNLPDFQRLSYADALDLYGTDKPDLRFGLPLHNLSTSLAATEFPPFANALAAAGHVVGLRAPGAASYTRKQLDALVDFVKQKHLGLTGLVYVKFEADGTFKSSADKFFAPETWAPIAAALEAQPGDLLLLAADAPAKVRKALGALRLHLGHALGLIAPDAWSVFWVVDFPLFESDDETGGIVPVHHPFVMPHPEDLPKLESNDPAQLTQVRAQCYDLVMNGSEILSGSVRIHRRDIQQRIFELLALTPEETDQKFGFLLRAFEYGAPPHAGCAFGLDRWVMLLAGGDTIRDVIAFPKNSAGRDVMLDAPGPVPAKALKELGIGVG
jgi:aspartyl-tRNA synthetase